MAPSLNRSFASFSALVAVLIGLSGCGGGGGSVGSTSISGSVIDGYIRGAVVCVDVNGNLRCDADEPRGVSGEGGAYSINAGFNVSGYNVIAEVGVDAVDEEEGPVTSAFSLAAPADSASVQVTPLTTMVSMELISNTDASITFAEKVSQARESVALATGISTAVLSSDFVKSAATSTDAAEAKKIARVVAVAIQEHKATVNANPAISQLSSTDAEKAKAASFKAAVETVRQQVLPKVVNEGKLTGDINSVIATVKQDVATVATGKVAVIVANTKLDTPKVANLSENMSRGFFIANEDSGRYRNAQGGCVEYDNKTKVSFVSGSPDSLQEVQAILVDKQWFSSCDQWLDYYWTGSSWLASPDGPPSGIKLSSQNCAAFPWASGSSITTNVCLVQRDFSGKKITETVLDACDSDSVDSAQMAACNAAVFAEGSLGFDLTQSISADALQIWAGDVGNPSDPISTASSLQEFIRNAYTNNDTLWGFRRVYARIESINSESNPTSGVLVWSTDSRNFSGGQKTNFEVKRVLGKEAMIINLPPIYRVENPDDADHQARVFVRINSGEISGLKPGIYTGQMEFAAIKQQQDFLNSSGSKFGTIELLNSFTDAVGVPRFPVNGVTSSAAR